MYDEIHKSSMKLFLKSPVDKARKNKDTVFGLLDGAPQAKIQLQGPACLVEREGSKGNGGGSARPPDNTGKHSDGKAVKPHPAALVFFGCKTNSHRQEKIIRSRENKTKKTQEHKQVRTRVRQKGPWPMSKRKRNPLELSRVSIKKLRTHQGMHILELLQVFHALGKKNDKTGLFSSHAVENSGSTPELRPSQLSHQSWISHVRGNILRKPRAQP